MKAKLIKNKDGGYILLHDPSGWVIGSTDHEYVASHRGEQIVSKLSKQNCEEEFAKAMGVVDVEKLADETWKDLGVFTENDKHLWFGGFKNGFNKAIELNKDKVFSKGDMVYIMNIMSIHELSFEDAIIKFQSLQQPTEIEVEIVMEPIGRVKLGVGSKLEQMMPKLDSEGCLILKKI